MPEVIDCQAVADLEGCVRAALVALGAGQVVVLPTETGYALAANGRSLEAGETLRQLLPDPDELWPLAVPGEAAALAWAPGLGALGRRLIRRLWPGPVTLAVTADAAEGAVKNLPRSISRRVLTDRGLRLRCPAHEIVFKILEQSREPLLVTNLPPDMDAVSATGPQMAEALGDQVALILSDGPIRFPGGPTVIRIAGDAWEIIRPGVIPADLIERQTVCLIVFVCTGNTCRSPLAEALCKKRLCDRLGCAPDDLRQRGFMVLSAGLFPYYGGPAAQEAIEVAQLYGADLSRHRSRGLSDDLLFQADHVIGMTNSHVEALKEVAAGLPVRPRVLSANGEDLPDPVGADRPVYEACAATIWLHLEPLIDEILPKHGAGPANP